MRYSSITLGLMAAGSSLAAPLNARASNSTNSTALNFNAPPGGDITILNYALTLEYLERKFYQEGLANYSKHDFESCGFGGKFYENLKEIYFDEQTHVSFLSGALGSAAVQEATYAFPSTDAKSFVQLASVLEGVGVSAYLGAAQAIANKAYLTAAGSILTVESRHSSYIRAALKESPFPKPFDTPLDFNTVFSLAAQFITGFAANDTASGMLPFKAFPALTVAPSKEGYYKAGGSSLTFTGAYEAAKHLGLVKSDKDAVYAVFYSGLDVYYVKTAIDGNDYVIDAIPMGDSKTLPPTGQVYIVLSTADGAAAKVSDDNVVSGVGVIEVLK